MLQSGETITKRLDGRYMGRFIIDHRDNGKPVYQYVYGKTYEEAEKKLFIARTIEKIYLSGKSITIFEAYKEWLDTITNRVKESTYMNYKMKFEKHLLPAFGSLLCTEINSAVINQFIKIKIIEGLSAGYIHDLFNVFRNLLNYIQDEYSIQLSLKNVSLPRKEKKKVNKISDSSQKQLIDFINTNMSRTGLGILLSLFMGLRIGELCALKWKDIDLVNKVLYINRTAQRIYKENGNRKTTVIISSPKSNTSKRCIPIPDFLVSYLSKYKTCDEDYILSGTDKIIEPRSMQYRFQKILDAADVQRANYHKLRSTFATNCIENGCDAKTLSCFLGHSTVNLTLDKYVLPDFEYEHQMINRLSERVLCQSVSDKI